jgi:tRNA A37 threonylcarbamoyladenosine dehydratase
MSSNQSEKLMKTGQEVPTGQQSSPFSRTALIVGREGLRKLEQAHITIVGLGAVGSYALEAVARLGVGHLRLVDFDVVKLSNFNRQLLAIEENLGKPKVEAARERVRQINPCCRVESFQSFFHTDTFEAIFRNPTDLVLDAIDALNPKVRLLATLTAKGIPLVSSMGAATRTDPFAIRVGDLTEVTGCPLALRVRKRLKKLGVVKPIRCIYSVEPPVRLHWEDLDQAASHPETAGTFTRGRKRQILGSLSYLTGMFGLIAAQQVFNFIIDGRFSK